MLLALLASFMLYGGNFKVLFHVKFLINIHFYIIYEVFNGKFGHKLLFVLVASDLLVPPPTILMGHLLIRKDNERLVTKGAWVCYVMSQFYV